MSHLVVSGPVLSCERVGFGTILEFRASMVVAGASAVSRCIDHQFETFEKNDTTFQKDCKQTMP